MCICVVQWKSIKFSSVDMQKIKNHQENRLWHEFNRENLFPMTRRRNLFAFLLKKKEKEDPLGLIFIDRKSVFKHFNWNLDILFVFLVFFCIQPQLCVVGKSCVTTMRWNEQLWAQQTSFFIHLFCSFCSVMWPKHSDYCEPPHTNK